MPDPTAEKVIKAADVDERLMERYEKAILSSSVRLQRAIKNDIDEALSKLVVDDDGHIRARAQNIEILRALEDEIQERLTGSKYEKLRSELTGTLKKRVETINSFAKTAGIATIEDPKTLPFVLDRIDNLHKKLINGTEWSVDQFRDLLTRYRGDIQGNKEIDYAKLVHDFQVKGRVMPQYARAVADMNLSALDRGLKDMQADKSGIQHMKYLGPLDSVTRPFCSRHVGDIKSREYWRTIYNDVGPNPALLHGGGWGCRHRLVPFRPEWED